MPFHAAAGAKTILAFASSELVDRVLSEKLPRFSPNTITDPNILKEELEEVRRQGIGFDRGEFNTDVYAIGAPIFNDQQIRAAICICSPSGKMESYIESGVHSKLKEAAKKISDQLLQYNM